MASKIELQDSDDIVGAKWSTKHFQASNKKVKIEGSEGNAPGHPSCCTSCTTKTTVIDLLHKLN